MTDNEIKSIEELKSHIENCEYSINAMECTPEDYDEDVYKSIEEELKTSKDLLNLIEKQEKEIEKKDKIINEVYKEANNILYFDDSSDYCCALWEILRIINPELEDYPTLKYID